MAMAQAEADATLDRPNKGMGWLTASPKKETMFSEYRYSEDQLFHDHSVCALQKMYKESGSLLLAQKSVKYVLARRDLRHKFF